MNRRLRSSNKKREHGEDQNKRKKLEVPEEAVAITNLTDVNDDCLVHIFQYLSLRQLMNVADTCKRFQASTQTVFAAKCRGRKITLYPGPEPNRMNTIAIYDKKIYIHDLMSSLKVLRHIGIMILKLHILFLDLEQDQIAALAWYMNEYCADSLIDLKIDGAPNGMTKNWTKKFSNVESIELSRCDLENVSTWFPNIRRWMLPRYTQCINYTFPHLEELDIYNHDYVDAIASIVEILRQNPHLQRLRLRFNGLDMKFMITSIEEIKSSIFEIEPPLEVEYP